VVCAKLPRPFPPRWHCQNARAHRCNLHDVTTSGRTLRSGVIVLRCTRKGEFGMYPSAVLSRCLGKDRRKKPSKRPAAILSAAASNQSVRWIFPVGTKRRLGAVPASVVRGALPLRLIPRAANALSALSSLL